MITNAADAGFSRACALLLLANLLDGLFTVTFLQLNLVRETNPLMGWFYSVSPLSFMLFKVSCVQLGMLILWQHRCRTAAHVAVRVTAGLYSVIVAYHCVIAASLPV